MNENPKLIIVGLIDSKKNKEKQLVSLKEAEMLVDTYGGKVTKVITQNASHRKASTYIGKGKVEELASLVEENQISAVVINDHLKSGQIFSLSQLISPTGDCQIWDRTQLILQIFKNHATTSEAKLQIKLAELNHKGPELSGIGIELSQQAGGIGTRGIGETSSEIMRRHWKKEIKSVEDKLEKVTQNRNQQMQSRKKSGIPTVSIVGYTNAGKTTLFNAISKKEDKVQNALFATLDSSVSSLFLQNVGKKIFVSDTIGFIQDLPTELIDAFKSTLMETINANLLLHVVDSSDKNKKIKIDTINKIIKDLKLSDKKQILVFNKSDLLSKAQKKSLKDKYDDTTYIFISAKENTGVEDLINLVEEELMKMGLKRAKHLEYLDK